VVLEAIDRIPDTATSMERIFVVEVMGRECTLGTSLNRLEVKVFNLENKYSLMQFLYFKKLCYIKLKGHINTEREEENGD